MNWSVGATAHTLWFGVDSYRKMGLFWVFFFSLLLIPVKRFPRGSLKAAS